MVIFQHPQLLLPSYIPSSFPIADSALAARRARQIMAIGCRGDGEEGGGEAGDGEGGSNNAAFYIHRQRQSAQLCTLFPINQSDSAPLAFSEWGF